MYDPINPPRTVVQLGFTHLQGAAGTPAAASLAARMWLYESADVHTAVGAPAYFTDAGKRGMALGDIVIVRCTATGEVTKHSVLALAASGKTWDSTPLAASISRIGAGYLAATLAAGTTNDLDPTLGSPMSSFDRLDLDLSGAAATVTGLLAGVDLQTMFITNRDAAFSVTLAAQSASSAAANRFTFSAVIPPLTSLLLVYHAGSVNRWSLS
jgi:hypothetical protein